MSEADHDPRLDRLLDVMLSIAQQDFEVEAPVSDRLDVIDAIAVGLNMLVEELRGEVASRRDLEQAHEELKRAQAKVLHAEKLAAIGQLAAGVAHEVNTPIQSVQVSLAIVERVHEGLGAELRSGRLDREGALLRMERAARAMTDAQQAIDRVRGVTDSLRTFARIDDDLEQEVLLDEVLRVSCRLVEPSARSRASLALALEEGIRVRGNRGRLGQVVTNLLVNAVQALPDGTPGGHRIRVTLERGERGAILVVEDSGPGVPPELRARIFDPFFTTKPEGVGTGLGLALAEETVRIHGGSLAVDDSPLGGARFTVILPVLVDGTAPVEGPPPSARRRRARLLLVDDEPVLLRLFASFLSDDYDVVTASSGEAAIDLLATDDRFDVVVCDMNMPGADGIDVFEAATRRAPALGARFVFATGGAFTPRSRQFLDAVRPKVLPKPFRIDALVALIEEAPAVSPGSS